MAILMSKYRSVIESHIRRCKKDYNRDLKVELDFLDWLIILMLTKGCCMKCNKYVGLNKLSTDLILSLKRGGQLTFFNVQCMCRSCNTRKFIHYDDLISKEFLGKRWYNMDLEKIRNKRFDYLINLRTKFSVRRRELIAKNILLKDDYELILESWNEDIERKCGVLRSNRMKESWKLYVERMWKELQERKKNEQINQMS